MFNIGLPEMLIILAIALIVFGPNKLPELARAFGKAMREFRKATDEVKESFREETKDLEEIKNNLNQETLLEDLARQIDPSNEPPGKTEAPSEPPAQETPAVSTGEATEEGKAAVDVSSGGVVLPSQDSPPSEGERPAGQGAKEGKEGIPSHGRG